MKAERRSFGSASFVMASAHGGAGEVASARVHEAEDSALRFVDLVVVPPRASVGMHRHRADTEIYVVIDGEGAMAIDDEVVVVSVGDVVINPPGGRHGIENHGDHELRIVVVDIG